ncbi:unnamed protein product [Prunus armeniaca]|uniref:General transcription factor 3C polypeptide 1 winged-helix domain-containing protein n=1 Tax=Prunus armeniaca TaxID=36596 RepID=A0A6J5XRY4_PRUAR|nr:unnamed protein product [Prunus armeniaca]
MQISARAFPTDFIFFPLQIIRYRYYSLLFTLQPSLSSFNLDVSDRGLKQALWAGLRSVPTLKFQSQNQKVQYSPTDPLIQSVQDAEKLNLKLVADQRLMNNFLGLYIAHSSIDNMCQYQRQTLERVAGARYQLFQSHSGEDSKHKGEEAKNLELLSLGGKYDEDQHIYCFNGCTSTIDG